MVVVVWTSVATFFAVASGYVARRRGQPPGGWVAIGFFFGPIGLLLTTLNTVPVVAAHPGPPLLPPPPEFAHLPPPPR